MSGSVSRVLLCSQAGFTGWISRFFWVCLVLYVQNIVHSLFQQVCGFLDKRQKEEVAVVYFPACPAAVSVVKAETFPAKIQLTQINADSLTGP